MVVVDFLTARDSGDGVIEHVNQLLVGELLIRLAEFLVLSNLLVEVGKVFHHLSLSIEGDELAVAHQIRGKVLHTQMVSDRRF